MIYDLSYDSLAFGAKNSKFLGLRLEIGLQGAAEVSGLSFKV